MSADKIQNYEYWEASFRDSQKQVEELKLHVQSLRIQLAHLIYLSEKLWGEVPIVQKFSEVAKVTHPLIENAKNTMSETGEPYAPFE